MTKPRTVSAQGHAANLTPEEFLKFVREANRLQIEVSETAEAAKSAVGALRAHRKAGKKNLGIDLEAFQIMTTLQNQEPEDAAMRIKNLQRYVSWLKLPFGTQLDMFGKSDDAPLTQDQEEAAIRIQQEETGYLRGVAGDTAEANPHKAGSVEYVAWETGRAKGDEFRTGTVKKSGNVTRPKGTRRKAGNPEDRAEA